MLQNKNLPEVILAGLEICIFYKKLKIILLN